MAKKNNRLESYAGLKLAPSTVLSAASRTSRGRRVVSWLARTLLLSGLIVAVAFGLSQLGQPLAGIAGVTITPTVHPTQTQIVQATELPTEVAAVPPTITDVIVDKPNLVPDGTTVLSATVPLDTVDSSGNYTLAARLDCAGQVVSQIDSQALAANPVMVQLANVPAVSDKKDCFVVVAIQDASKAETSSLQSEAITLYPAVASGILNFADTGKLFPENTEMLLSLEQLVGKDGTPANPMVSLHYAKVPAKCLIDTADLEDCAPSGNPAPSATDISTANGAAMLSLTVADPGLYRVWVTAEAPNAEIASSPIEGTTTFIAVGSMVPGTYSQIATEFWTPDGANTVFSAEGARSGGPSDQYGQAVILEQQADHSILLLGFQILSTTFNFDTKTFKESEARVLNIGATDPADVRLTGLPIEAELQSLLAQQIFFVKQLPDPVDEEGNPYQVTDANGNESSVHLYEIWIIVRLNK